jgi:hypothetical protein
LGSKYINEDEYITERFYSLYRTTILKGGILIYKITEVIKEVVQIHKEKRKKEKQEKKKLEDIKKKELMEKYKNEIEAEISIEKKPMIIQKTNPKPSTFEKTIPKPIKIENHSSKNRLISKPKEELIIITKPNETIISRRVCAKKLTQTQP